MYKIEGNTYPIKDQLKQLGCRWSGVDKCWTTNDEATYAKAVALLNGEEVSMEKPPPKPISIAPSRSDFKEKLQTYFEGCQKITGDDGWRSDRPWKLHYLKRWVRIEHGGAHSFVDIETGEVLKPANFKTPAITKIKRGNIFDEHNGLENIGPYGVLLADHIKGTGRFSEEGKARQNIRVTNVTVSERLTNENN
jgi:hypothetical protein